MPKVDMSRYIECPVCHTWQITLDPCQKCLARRMAERGTLPPSGIVPLDPFKVYSQEQRALGNVPKKKRECSKESEADMRKRMKATAKKSGEVKRERSLATKVPLIVSALSDGQPHELSKLIRKRIIPVGVTVTSYVPTRTMMQMGLLEWSKVGPHHNSPVRIWIPALKIQDAIEYAEGLKNGKNQRR